MGCLAGRLATAALLALWVGGGCASGRGATHVLRPGENLYRLSRYYDVSVRRIERANDIDEITQIPHC